MRDTKGITPHIAATTLHYRSVQRGLARASVGYAPSEWRKLLLTLITKSDPLNRALLARGFAGEVKAVELAEDSEGAGILRSIAREAGQG